MRVAIVHYHLKRGGVTRVIESTLNAFQSLQSPPCCTVLAGEVPDDCSFKEHAITVSGLEYSNAQEQTPEPAKLLANMREAASKALGGPPDIWHIHNHSLGKNSAMPGIVSLLAEAGDALLLHMHDFAEDGRPENYQLNQEVVGFAQKLYPMATNVHYAVLNGRDFQIFAEAGLSPDQLHLLANPVEGATNEVDASETEAIHQELGAERILLYPVRAVRRKNFGEMLFWAALAQAGDVFATTLGPTNQNYVAAYQDWQDFAQQHALPVRFEIGEQYDWSFSAIMQSANCILSTSIAEGFGLAFLEPWLFGKTIAGRDIPDITKDFKEAAIDLDHLYPALPIPETWIDMNDLRARIQQALSSAYQSYQQPLPENAVEEAIGGIQAGAGMIDFAGLDETQQRIVIERLVTTPESREELPLAELNIPPAANQAELICKRFSLEDYAQQVHGIYTTANQSSPSTPDYQEPESILNSFLKPNRFRLLRT